MCDGKDLTKRIKSFPIDKIKFKKSKTQKWYLLDSTSTSTPGA